MLLLSLMWEGTSMTTTQIIFRRNIAIRRGVFLLLIMGLAACGGSDGEKNPGKSPGNTTPLPALALFAGNLDGRGSTDGTGATARFNSPIGVATDSVDNVYVADYYNSTIRKITPLGVVSIFAGMTGKFGSVDGIGAMARFNNPSGVATDSANNVYVADTGNHTLRKITPAGEVSTLAGAAGISGGIDNTGTEARFNSPYSVAIDSVGNAYVADVNNHAIRKITLAGAVVTTFAGMMGTLGSADGAGVEARFKTPFGVATDSADNVYVTDFGNHTLRKITSLGVVSTLAGTPGSMGSADGIGAIGRFNLPRGVSTDSVGNVYVVDTENHTLRKITPVGEVSTLAGMVGIYGSADGTGAAASFNNPSGLTTDSADNIYVADTGNNTLRKITTASAVSTFVGMAGVSGSANGIGAAASFYNPTGVTTDSAGNIYVADINNHTLRKITPDGVVSTLAGAAGISGSTDNSVVAARFNLPYGMATDSAGNIYVTEIGNDTIRKITPEGVVSTLAGTAGISGSSDGIGAAASFYNPWGVTTDNSGNVYVADTGNHTLRKITPDGVVSTLAGTAGISGSVDRPGAAARFNNPIGVVTDSTGNVYVADANNHTLRKITSVGVVSTIAGAAGIKGNMDGIGPEARFNTPIGVATDSTGNIYVSDASNHTIRKITPAGVVSTIVGRAGQVGFVAGALPGGLTSPQAVAVYGTSLYITLRNGVAVVRNLQ